MWDYLGKTSDAISLLTFLFTVCTTILVWRNRKQLQRLAIEPIRNDGGVEDAIEAHKGVRTLKPMALALSLSSANVSIRDDVQNFLAASGLSMSIDEINFQGLNSREDLADYVKRLKEKRLDCEREGVTELHVFFQGPVAAAMQLGAIFRNWKPVKLYHKPQPAPPSIYEYWMPLF